MVSLKDVLIPYAVGIASWSMQVSCVDVFLWFGSRLSGLGERLIYTSVFLEVDYRVPWGLLSYPCEHSRTLSSTGSGEKRNSPALIRSKSTVLRLCGKKEIYLAMEQPIFGYRCAIPWETYISRHWSCRPFLIRQILFGLEKSRFSCLQNTMEFHLFSTGGCRNFWREMSDTWEGTGGAGNCL